MAKITIIDGNDEIELSTAPKENIKAYMVKGEPGTDGVSPTITASRSGKITTLTITDKNGTTQADINDGVDPTVTTSKVDRTTTMTITDINGTRTTEIYDGIDLTGGVPTNGVIGFDTDEIIYTCDGTETGDCYLTYDGVDFSFTMPSVEDGDVLVFNTSTLTLTLDGTTINTQPLPGTGTELTFDYDIPGGYERTDEPFPGAETSGGGIIALKSITTAPSTFSKDDKYYNSTDDLIYTATSSSAWNNGETPSATSLYLNEADNKLYRYYNNTMNIEAGETLPVGSEIDYDGTTVPTGWEEMTNYDTGWIEIKQSVLAQGTVGTGYYVPMYRRIGNVVYLRGQVTGVTTRASAIFTLPSGFYNTASRKSFCTTNDSLETNFIRVQNTGVVQIQQTSGTLSNGIQTYFDGISFTVD